MSNPLAVQPVLYFMDVQLAMGTERTPEGTSPLGEPVALELRMQPRTPPGKHGRHIGDDLGFPEHDPQK
jgi:hypothetical protein